VAIAVFFSSIGICTYLLILGFSEVIATLVGLLPLSVLWLLLHSPGRCSMPRCRSIGLFRLKVSDSNVLLLCRRHYGRILKSARPKKTGAPEPFFTRERNRLLRNPSKLEREMMENLARAGVLERARAFHEEVEAFSVRRFHKSKIAYVEPRL